MKNIYERKISPNNPLFSVAIDLCWKNSLAKKTGERRKKSRNSRENFTKFSVELKKNSRNKFSPQKLSLRLLFAIQFEVKHVVKADRVETL